MTYKTITERQQYRLDHRYRQVAYGSSGTWRKYLGAKPEEIERYLPHRLHAISNLARRSSDHRYGAVFCDAATRYRGALVYTLINQ